jgi:branched-chain amino acid transport system ATP-binding protein
MTTPVMQLQKLDVFYGHFHAVHGIDMDCDAGEIVSVIGANGAGKSSVMKAIMGQVGRTQGQVLLDGKDIKNLRTPERIKQGVALVPEGRRLFPSLSVEENLNIGLYTARPGGIGLQDVFDIFPVLKDRRAQRASQLSGGQQQMVAIGRALLMNPRIVLFDEISLGLAPLIVKDIYKILPKLSAKGLGVVVVEQDISRSLAVADRFYCLLEGRVTLSGRPADFTREDVANSYFGMDH